MARYNILFRKSAVKELEKISQPHLGKIINRIQTLANDPGPAGCEKLSESDKYRIRQGRYRIVYSIQDKELTIWVVKIGHRKDIYQKL